MKEIKLTKSGEYMCSACRAAPRQGIYSRKWKWKTEGGFQRHSCYADERENLKRRDEEFERRKTEATEVWKESAKHKIGDVVWFSYYIITKPTHIQRGSRMVKVRYEEERLYRHNNGTITGYIPGGYIIDNRRDILESGIKSEIEAAADAQSSQKSYDEHVGFSSFCR